MNIYLAGAFESQARLRIIRDCIVALGHTVSSTWLDEDYAQPPQAVEDLLTDDQAREYAIRDLSEIRVCDAFILDTLETNERGGKDWEAGYAYRTADYGTHFPVSLRVGLRRNVFHTLANRSFTTWEECLEWLTH